MAYKKYITRNGKVYGPYIYHSKRVDGKVISEYRGPSKLEKSNKTLPIVIASLLIISAILTFSLYNPKLSGEAIFNVLGSFSGENLSSGKLNFVLTEGELIPSNSKIIIENNQKVYEYDLNALLEEEETINGDFNLNNGDVSGSGEGYGLIGTKESFPTINFELILYNEEEQTPEENETTEPPIEPPVENETNNEEPEETTEPPVETTEEETIETDTTEEETQEEPTEETQEETPPEERSEITGNAISQLFDTASKVFLGIITGRVSDEPETISGEISKNEDFEYSTNGRKVKIVEGSIESEGKKLDENILLIEELEDKIIIKTDYSISEKGFGEEYYGDKTKTFSIDLSKINEVLVEGDLNVKIIYEDKEIISFNKQISSETIKSIEEETPEKTTEGLIIKYIDLLETLIFPMNLTENELNIIKFRLNKTTVDTKVSKYKNRFLVDFTFADYEIQHSYPGHLTEEELMKSMERDKYLWIKDIITDLERERTQKEELPNLSGSYPI